MSTSLPFIQLNDTTTWPTELFDYVNPLIPRIGRERELELAKNLEGKSWLQSIPDSKYLEAQKQLATMLRSYAVRAYHCTRLLDPEINLQSGLEPLRLATLSARIHHVADALPVPDSSFVIEEEIAQFAHSSDFLSQQGLLWFYLSEEQTQHPDSQDLLDFYGGRSLRAVLVEQRFRFYPLLKRMGTPAVLACRIRLADATESQVEELAKLMLDYIVDAATGLNPKPIAGELSIRKGVTPEDILGIKGQLQLEV